MMKKDRLKKIITVASVLTSLLSFESAYAAEPKIDPRVINPKYTYIGGDINAILKQRLQNKAVVMEEYVQGMIPIAGMELGRDITIEARKGTPVVMPIHLGAQVFGQGGHWTGVAVFAKPGGKFVIFYNDPLGTSANKTRAAMELISDIITAAGDANVEVIDLQVKQQSDGTSCGAYTAENLIALASLDTSKLTEAEAKAVLSKLTNAKNIRWLHGGVINNFEELTNSDVTRTHVETVHAAALNDLSNLSSLTTHRLNDLYLASNIKGFNSGDDAISYGAWVRGNLGNGNYKAKDSTKFKNKFNGATIGVDGKITEDFTIGLAVNVSSSNLKPKATSQNNNLGSNYNGIIGSVYGSFIDTDAVVYNLKLEGGKVNSKAHYNSTVNGKNTIKFSGTVWKTSFDTSYYAQVGQVVLVPSIGISYEKAEFNKTKHVNFNIGKTSVEKLTLTPGIKVTKSIDLGGVQVIPAVYASTNYSPLTESSKITVKSNNGFVLSEGAMPVVENSHNVGASITVASHNIEASLGYERIIQEKYQGQVGYIKLRINF